MGSGFELLSEQFQNELNYLVAMTTERGRFIKDGIVVFNIWIHLE